MMAGEDDLQISIESRDSTVVIKPEGDIDLSCSPVFRRSPSTIYGKKPARIIVDLAGVPYMDSSGVATLVEAMQMSRRGGSKLILCELQDKVRSVFEIARLDTVFTIVPTVDEAMALV